MKKRIFSFLNLFLVAAFILTSGAACKSPGADTAKLLQPITLNYWRVWDDADAFDGIIKDYQAIHPNIKINYRKFRYEEYERELLNAFAEDRGPDIFSIPASWLGKYQPKLLPMPAKITMAYQREKTTFGFKKETIVETKTIATPSARSIKESFLDTVYPDATIENQIYGLPLSLETLVMFYNKDILNQSGVVQVPTTWKSFQEAAQKITKIDSENNIIQAGTALGTGSNVSRVFDIISILMMQSGAQMADQNGAPTFFKNVGQENPGASAVNFYSEFASPIKNVYSWNAKMRNSLDAFIAGQVGFTFGYTYNLPTIRSAAPRLNFGIAPIPQISAEIAPKNYANYWLETVAKKSKNPNEAWDFIIFATQEKEAKKYLAKTNNPTALKNLINAEMEDEDLHADALQALTATGWYRGNNPLGAEDAFKEMADNYLKAGNEKEQKAVLQTALQKINQTMK